MLGTIPGDKTAHEQTVISTAGWFTSYKPWSLLFSIQKQAKLLGLNKGKHSSDDAGLSLSL